MGGATKETIKEQTWRRISFLSPAIISPSNIALDSETYLYVQSGSMAGITKNHWRAGQELRLQGQTAGSHVLYHLFDDVCEILNLSKTSSFT